MCEPTSILTGASLAVAVGGAGASIAGQTQTNKAANQVEAQKEAAVQEQITENRRRATADYIAKVQDEQLLQRQEQEDLVEKTIDLQKQERHMVAQTVVASAESGVSGQSLAAIQNDYRFQLDSTAARLGVNQDRQDYQHTRTPGR